METLDRVFVIFLLAQYYLTLGDAGWGTQECTKNSYFD